ncbi:MAG: peptidase M16, partial [Gammaproteobacteria bacterium]|nr:peptidase M16 [Gammaproteobacteria bacterium]
MNMNTYNFELREERTIGEIDTVARLYRHTRTGAQILSLINDDENKVFGIAFATPSGDSTGIAHVMEHSVLCGSRRYPLKEPFVELIKASLNTFLNAMTWPDHTVFPVASQHAKDLYNLIDVYLDAVFYPNLTRWTLMQEGWHYELDSPSEALRFKGVVFNEMKGNYSSPDGMLAEYVRRSLFPDTIYGQDSGGDPAAIPDLTYDRFKAFHATYYHPSNARIFFYGDDDPEERLRYLDAWLSDFEPLAVAPELPLQPRWTTPIRRIEAYDPGEDANEQLGYVSVNWLLGE